MNVNSIEKIRPNLMLLAVVARIIKTLSTRQRTFINVEQGYGRRTQPLPPTNALHPTGVYVPTFDAQQCHDTGITAKAMLFRKACRQDFASTMRDILN